MSKVFNNIFQEINMPIEEVVDLMDIMNISSTELANPKKQQKFRTIAEFVKDIPNKRRFFTRITKAERVDMVDFMYEYCLLRLDYESALTRQAENENLLLRSPDDGVLLEQKENLGAEIAEIESTLNIYEN